MGPRSVRHPARAERHPSIARTLPARFGVRFLVFGRFGHRLVLRASGHRQSAGIRVGRLAGVLAVAVAGAVAGARAIRDESGELALLLRSFGDMGGSGTGATAGRQPREGIARA